MRGIGTALSRALRQGAQVAASSGATAPQPNDADALRVAGATDEEGNWFLPGRVGITELSQFYVSTEG
jgi:hypothetical protein